MSTMLEYMSRGGPMMWVILLSSIVGAVIFFERAFNLWVLRKLDVKGFMDSVLAHVEARRFRQALDVCEIKSKHPLVPVVRAGLLRANRREKEIERAMENEMLQALPHIQKRIDILGLLGNTATLLGLLGTIFGLIGAFASVAAASAAERQQALADGISQAMYTTAFGIAAAVPLLFFHHFLTRRMEQVTSDIEGGATSLMVSLTGVVREIRAPDAQAAAPAKSSGSAVA